MMESSKKNEEIGAWFLEPIKEGKTHEEKDIGSQLKGSILEYWQQVFDESYNYITTYKFTPIFFHKVRYKKHLPIF